MPYHNDISEKCESAAKLAFAGFGLTLSSTFHQGFSSDTLTGNYITFVAESANPLDQFPSGNWAVTLRMEVVSSADSTTQAQHALRFGEAASYWFQSSDVMCASLNSAGTDFTAQFIVPGRQYKEIRERKWVTVQEVTINCAGTSGLLG